ncbi:DUF1501 domain-containing protein [Urbifossiella limnaea]|uniref:DUF1501 domain-containing protein n=1 Tax=Urbifossiella limnaea TaxID=2528023 RepID=A0A517XQM1_9BACT|nr:DUF1501 domain-containing protein [Urbifossiella limnaea]QDU19786.1 hypothetical protein ETAA1_17240 [Urbifossiella limnaea]
MLNVLGSSKRLRDGFTRRELIQAGAGAVVGLGLTGLTRTPATAGGGTRPRHFGKAKSVMVLYLYGAMSQIDTLDPKPDAPAEIRGPFRSMATKLPGVRLGEHLPLLADRLDRVTMVRSMNHPEPIHNVANTVTGISRTDVPMELNQRHPRHWPFFGSVIDYLETTQAGRAGDPLIPRNVILPWRQSATAPDKRAGFFGGFLGSRYDPTPLEFRGKGTVQDCVEKFNPYCGVDPRDAYNFPATDFGPQMTVDRFRARRGLLDELDDRQRYPAGTAPLQSFGELQQIGLRLCDSATLPAALNLAREPAKLRERYGHHLFGQSTLLGRRMIEAGSRVVTVLWDEFAANNSAWDTHNNQTRRLGRELCPGFDRSVSALLDDLEQRGLLDETLVVCLTEHGRTPQAEGNGDGRNHWSGAYSIMLAGAGVARGNVVGSSDRQGAFVKTRPVNPKDILHSIYHLLGIDVERSIPDRQGRPMPLVDGGHLVPEILA